MKTTAVKAYITKDFDNAIEIWKSAPKFDGEYWKEGDKMEVGSEICDEDFLDNLVEQGQCVEIQISPKKVIFDYSKSPEGRLMNAIFGK